MHEIERRVHTIHHRQRTEQAPHQEHRQSPEGEAPRQEVIHADAIDGSAERKARNEEDDECEDADPVEVEAPAEAILDALEAVEEEGESGVHEDEDGYCPERSVEGRKSNQGGEVEPGQIKSQLRVLPHISVIRIYYATKVRAPTEL